jgi:hypothetical protein
MEQVDVHTEWYYSFRADDPSVDIMKLWDEQKIYSVLLMAMCDVVMAAGLFDTISIRTAH